MVTEGHKDRVPRCERGTSATELQPFFLRMWVTADLSEQNLPLSPSCRSFGNFPFQALLFVRRWEGISLASSQGPYLWNWSALQADPLVVVLVVVSFLPNQLRSLLPLCSGVDHQTIQKLETTCSSWIGYYLHEDIFSLPWGTPSLDPSFSWHEQ